MTKVCIGTKQNQIFQGMFTFNNCFVFIQWQLRHRPSKTVFCHLKKLVYFKSIHSLPVSLQSIMKSWKYLKMSISFIFALVPSSLNSATTLSRMRSLVGLKLIMPSTKRGCRISLLLRTSSRRQNDSKPILSWSSIGMIV